MQDWVETRDSGREIRRITKERGLGGGGGGGWGGGGGADARRALI